MIRRHKGVTDIVQSTGPSRQLSRRELLFLVAVVLFASCLSCGESPPRWTGAPHQTEQRASISRLVVVVIDQFRADYLTRYELPSLRALQDSGVTFDNAIVGHLASETVVSHPVLGTGLLPKNLPWGDEAMRDYRGLLGTPGSIYLSGYFELAEVEATLCRSLRELPDYQGTLAQLAKSELGGGVHVVGQKEYAVYSFGACGADSLITFGDPLAAGPLAGYTGPSGKGVPPTMQLPQGERFYVNAARKYGAGSMLLTLKGDQYVAGDDPKHEGGDLWVVNVAIDMTRHDPQWSALLLTMSSVDAIGHLLGSYYGPVNLGQDPAVTLENAIMTADRAVGRLVDHLKSSGWHEQTLFVVTSDHGGTSGRLYGEEAPNRAYFNYYWGRSANAPPFLAPSPALEPLTKLSPVDFIMADTAIRLWLKEADSDSQQAVVRILRELPGVVSVYRRGHDGYQQLADTGKVLSPATRTWDEKHLPSLLESLAAPHAPDLIALLEPNVTYGARGDHGGHQEEVQRIPLIFSGPGVARGERRRELARLVDIVPTICHLLGGTRRGYDGIVLPAEKPVH